jgi:hypothetical protein
MPFSRVIARRIFSRCPHAHLVWYSVTSQVSFNGADEYREKVRNPTVNGEYIVLCGSQNARHAIAR